MNRNFDLRRRMFGDAALGQTNLRMIEVLLMSVFFSADA